MDVTHIRIIVTVIATMTAIIFTTLATFFPLHAVLLLSIEAISLPAVYIIGNQHTEHIAEQQHNERLNQLARELTEINRKYYKLYALSSKNRGHNDEK